jgi:hypothetical protein
MKKVKRVARFNMVYSPAERELLRNVQKDYNTKPGRRLSEAEIIRMLIRNEARTRGLI